MSHDPKLRKAMAEIVPILEKYQCGAAVTLVSQTHTEYRYEFPAWSCIGINRKTGEVRVRIRREDFKTIDDYHLIVGNTAHLVCQLRDLAAQNFADFQKLVDLISMHWEFDHKPYHEHEPYIPTEEDL